MIIQVRGSNGSGKSTVVRKFITSYPAQEIYGVLGPRRPEAYKVGFSKTPLYVLGPYHNATGGVDALGLSLEGLIKLLEKYSAQGHVLFEGVIISTIFGTIGKWFESHKKDVSVVYLDTPLEECLKALGERGTGKGRLHVASKVKAITRTRDFMDEAGIFTVVTSRDSAFDCIKSLLR